MRRRPSRPGPAIFHFVNHVPQYDDDGARLCRPVKIGQLDDFPYPLPDLGSRFGLPFAKFGMQSFRQGVHRYLRHVFPCSASHTSERRAGLW
jgi:hypothetical protein